ncbi:MAG: hypothetical protein ACTSX4_06600 [Candidatus Helarchaeota archaeon]
MDSFKKLNQEKDKLVDDIKKLNRMFEHEKISQEEYEKKKHVLERSLVEVMDHLVQYKHLLNLK